MTTVAAAVQQYNFTVTVKFKSKLLSYAPLSL